MLPLVAAISLTCQINTAPSDGGPEHLQSSGVDRPAISIDLRADKQSVAAGDTVHFVIVARNSSDQRIQVGVQCGPAMDVRIRTPERLTLSVLNAQFEREGEHFAFTCELGPYHFVEPRDSLINRLWWKAPQLSGDYAAVAGARGQKGLDDVSAPLIIRVF